MTLQDERYSKAIYAIEEYLWLFDPFDVAGEVTTSMVDEVTDALITASRGVEAAVLGSGT